MRRRLCWVLGGAALIAGLLVLAHYTWQPLDGRGSGPEARPGNPVRVQAASGAGVGTPMAGAPHEGAADEEQPWSWELPDPPRDDPARMINWVDYQVEKRRGQAFGRLTALLGDLPREWDGNQRDRLRAVILYKLGVLGDPRAIPVIEAYVHREPEGEGFEVEDPENGERGRGWYFFNGAAEESLAHLRFLDAHHHAKTDDERAELCMQDLLRIWAPGGTLVGIQPGGLEFLLEGRERYVSYLREATRRLPEQSSRSIAHLLELMIEKSHSNVLEDVLVEIAKERTDSVAASVVGTLRDHGSPRSLPALEEIARRQESQRGDLVQQAIDAIEWRKVMQDTQGKPSVEQLRWALDRFAITKEAQKVIADQGNWPLDEIRRDIEGLSLIGQRACLNLLRSRMEGTANREGPLRLAHELSSSSSRFGVVVRDDAIQLIAQFGSDADRAVLADRASRLRAKLKSAALAEDEWRELDVIDMALRLADHKK